MSTAPRRRASVEEYLALERAGTERHELVDGEIFAMEGASHAHNVIVSNLVFELRRQLGDGPCYPLSSDMRVRAGPARYLYPDVVVVCGDAELEGADVLTNPTVIMEVLSDSTEADDRGAKFAHYRDVATLREYVLCAQHERRVEQFVRQSDARWLWSETTAADVPLSTLGIALPLDGIYRRALEAR